VRACASTSTTATSATPGFKYNEWELKGVPVRFEVGPNEVEDGEVTVVHRPDGEDTVEDRADITTSVFEHLDTVYDKLYDAAAERLDENVREASDRNEILGTIGQHGGYVKAPWCGDEECEAEIKEQIHAEIVMVPWVRSPRPARPPSSRASASPNPTTRARPVRSVARTQSRRPTSRSRTDTVRRPSRLVFSNTGRSQPLLVRPYTTFIVYILPLAIQGQCYALRSAPCEHESRHERQFSSRGPGRRPVELRRRRRRRPRRRPVSPRTGGRTDGPREPRPPWHDGAEENTGDGAGALIQTPDEFLAAEFGGLPETYAVGSLFLPQDADERAAVRETIESTLAGRGLAVVDWRDVPTDNADLGQTARDSEPHVAQCLVRPDGCADFEKALYVGRNDVEAAVDHDQCYVCSLDADTLVYKGLLKGDQVGDYYPDLRDERVETGFALVHARFSTNTLGAWHLAHPYRNIVHNGEFNTIQGNVNWMRAREADLDSAGFTDDELEAVLPVVDDPEQSDTASVDNALELLMQTGRSLPHALRMLVPEAWQRDDRMSDARREFYDYHASLVEPWDGPALVIGTDGDRVGGVLDRNGLRPCRYEVRADGTLVMASEQGALDGDASEVTERGRLAPGQLFLAEPGRGVVDDDAVFDELTDEQYGEWVDDQQLRPETGGDSLPSDPTDDLRATQALFGYTEDELNELVAPMVADGKDPVGSMGDDTPLPGLSSFNHPLASYFRQLFAQVTNPPIDYIREDLVTSVERRASAASATSSRSPRNTHGRRSSTARAGGRRPRDAPGHRPPERHHRPRVRRGRGPRERRRGRPAGRRGRRRGRRGAAGALGPRRRRGSLPIPSLLATGAVHHHLVREGLRARVGLVVEAGDVRTVHQLCATVGYGAGAVNPYLAVESACDIVAGPDGAAPEDAVSSYLGALEDGLLKVMSKMGISTVASYQGAQIFEAVGLDSSVVDRFFEGTANRTEGIDLDGLETHIRDRHAAAFEDGDPALDRIGEFENRTSGRFHQWNPKTVHSLQEAVENGDYGSFEEYAVQVNDQTEQLQTLRGLLDIETEDRESIPVEDVEPVSSIVERFSTAAMSLGSLSPEAHETNAQAANGLGAKANTGEGGEPPERFGTDRECKIKQVASGRFGVTSEYLASAEDLQIKMAQGSKPGEGGHLPGRRSTR